MERIELDHDQLAAVERMANEPTRAALNASQYGTGKTVVSVEVAKAIQASCIIIACPLFTKYSWAATIKGQYPDSQIYFINSTKSGRDALANLLAGVEGWYIIGREYFATKKVSDQIAPYSPNIDMLIYDECAKWANYKSKGFAVMRKMKPKYRMALSATPFGNKFANLYAITQWLWPKLEGHRSYWQFVADHCETETDYWAGIVVKGEKNPGEFVSSLPCYIRLEKDFGTPDNQTIYIELSPKERALYDKLEKYLIVWLKEHPLVVKFPATKRIRLRQMTLGEVSIDPENDIVGFSIDMESTKYDTLVEILKEYPDEPMLIFTHSEKFAQIVSARLLMDGFRALPWTGKVDEDLRHAMKVSFMAGDLDYIVATPGSIGEGTDGLQHRCHIMVWLSRDDNGMLNEQAFRRLLRRGQTKTVISIDIVALDTYDEGQLSDLIEQALANNRSLMEK